jgi:Protein of unknown function (DUF5663)
MDDYKVWLRDAKVSLADEQMERLAEKIQRELEWRVGEAITDNLNEVQLDEFEQLLTSGDADRNLEWLNKNYPEYPQVVARESEKLHQELLTANDAVGLIEVWPKHQD